VKRLLAGLAVCTVVFAPLAASADDAAGIWKAKCAKCHGADGSASSGMGKKLGIPDYTKKDNQAKWKDAELKDAISKGIPAKKMPAFEDLSAADVDALVKHIRTLAK